MTEHETVSYDFQANGVRDVVQAFQTVENVMLRAERVSIDSARREALKRLETSRDGAKKRVELEKKANEDIAAQDKLRLSRHQAHQNARTEIDKRHTQKRKDAEIEMYRELERMAEEHARKKAQIEEKAHRDMVARRKQYAQLIGGAAVGSVGSMASTAASWGAAALTLGGGLSVTNAAQKYMSAESASISLANSMFNPNDKEQQAWLKKSGRARFDDKAIMALAAKTQASSGIDKADLAKGWQDYIAKSSDWKAVATQEGQGTLMELAKMAKATGTDFGQLMSAAGSLRVQNEKLAPDEMLQMMRVIIGQGKMGAVEMKDLASHASVVTSGAGSFAMGQTAAQKALLGLSQIAIRTSGTPAEAATAVARFSSDVQHHSKEMNKTFGIDAIADKKTGALHSPSEILAQIFEKTGGNTAKFGEGRGNVGLGRESVRIAQALAPTYQMAVQEAKNKGVKDDKQLAKIGSEAVRKEVQKFERAGYDQKDIDEDLKRVLSGTQERFDKVVRDLTDKLEARVVPFLEKLAAALEKNAPELEHFMDALAKIATYLVENPWKGIGAAVSTKLVTDIGSAAVGKAVGDALSTLIGNSIGANAGAGSLRGLGSAGAIAAAVTLQVDALYVTTAEILEWKSAGQRDGKETADRMKSGDAEQRAIAVATLKDAHSKSSSVEVAAAYAAKFSDYAALINPVTAPGFLLGKYGTEAAAEKITGKKASDRALEVLKAKDLIDTYDVQMKVSHAIAQGVRDGVANAKSDPLHPTRVGPLTSPPRQ